MILLYMDENVEGPITRGARRRGVDVLTVQEDGRSGVEDGLVLDRSTKLNRLLFSRDEDMLAEAKRRQVAGEPFLGIIYVHQDRLSIGQCITDLEVIAFTGRTEEFANQVRYLPLR